MTGGGDKTGGQWGDLRTRVVSGVILAALGVGLLVSSGAVMRAGRGLPAPCPGLGCARP